MGCIVTKAGCASGRRVRERVLYQSPDWGCLYWLWQQQYRPIPAKISQFAASKMRPKRECPTKRLWRSVCRAEFFLRSATDVFVTAGDCYLRVWCLRMRLCVRISLVCILTMFTCTHEHLYDLCIYIYTCFGFNTFICTYMHTCTCWYTIYSQRLHICMFACLHVCLCTDLRKLSALFGEITWQNTMLCCASFILWAQHMKIVFWPSVISLLRLCNYYRGMPAVRKKDCHAILAHIFRVRAVNTFGTPCCAFPARKGVWLKERIGEKCADCKYMIYINTNMFVYTLLHIRAMQWMCKLVCVVVWIFVCVDVSIYISIDAFVYLNLHTNTCK